MLGRLWRAVNKLDWLQTEIRNSEDFENLKRTPDGDYFFSYIKAKIEYFSLPQLGQNGKGRWNRTPDLP